MHTCYSAILAVMCVVATTTTAFSGPATFGSRLLRNAGAASSSSSSALYISSWGTKGPPHRWADETQKEENPEEKIQAYIKTPEPVEARTNIDGTVLVSGLVRSKERTDQTIYDLLNHEESAFQFDKIVAFVDDIKFAKKRLLSRHARYTGLLDKLDLMEASSPGALPTAEQLDGVKSWVVVLEIPTEDLLEQVKAIATLAKSASSVENVAILMTNAIDLDMAATKDAVDSLKDPSLTFSVIAVGKIEDHAEGKVPYQFRQLGTDEGKLEKDAIFSRDESLRMVTECLQLESGSNKALACSEVYNVNQTEAKLIKGLREAGYTRPQEIDHVIREGPEAYLKAIEEFKTKNPNAVAGSTSDAWWERPEYALKHQTYEEEEEMRKAQIKAKQNSQVEQIAREWAKREYFRKSMAGTLENPDMKEEEFITSVWDRALFEGDLKFRQMNGEATNEEGELADFKSKQEKKKQTMLARAKQELADILEEEDLGGLEIEAKVDNDDDDADEE